MGNLLPHVDNNISLEIICKPGEIGVIIGRVGARKQMPKHASNANSTRDSRDFTEAGAHKGPQSDPIGSVSRPANRGGASRGAGGRPQAVAQLRESIAASPRILFQRLELEHSFGYSGDGDESANAPPENIPSRVAGAFARPVQRETSAQDSPAKEARGKVIVEDGDSPGAGQAQRSVFLAYLRKRVEEVAREVLGRVGMNEEDCPYIPYWFGYYGSRSVEQMEAAIGRYAPGSLNQKDWRACAEQLVLKVREAFEKNVGSGSLDGVPKELPHDLHERTQQILPAKAALPESDTIQACGSSQPLEKVGGLPEESVKKWGLQPGGDKEITVHTSNARGKVETEKKLAPTYQAPQGTRLYHATFPQAVESIMSTGLDPNYGGKSGGSDYDHWARNCKGYVYLTPASARAAAGLLQNFWLGQGGTDDPPRGKQNLPAVAVLHITVPAEGLSLEADPDLGGVSVRTTTMVEPGWIGDAEVFDAGPDNPEYREAMRAEEGRKSLYSRLVREKKEDKKELELSDRKD